MSYNPKEVAELISFCQTDDSREEDDKRLSDIVRPRIEKIVDIIASIDEKYYDYICKDSRIRSIVDYIRSGGYRKDNPLFEDISLLSPSMSSDILRYCYVSAIDAENDPIWGELRIPISLVTCEDGELSRLVLGLFNDDIVRHLKYYKERFCKIEAMHRSFVDDYKLEI